MTITRKSAPRQVRVLAAAALALALLACTPAAGNAVPTPTPTPTTVAAASPTAPPAASPAPLATVAPGPNMVAYASGGAAGAGEHKGYLALPAGLAAGAKAPGVVMIHEWWGLNDHIRSQADTLAREGYVVLAVDLFGGKYATTADQARGLTGGLDQAAATANLTGAVSYLRARPDVGKVASLGWCFGGGQSLKLLQAQKDLAAGVIYYGSLESDPEKVRGLPPILGIFGKLDQGPSPAQVQAFEQALTTADVRHEIHSYEGAGHAFANPTGGERYRPEAAADAWAKTLAFLSAHTK